MGWNFKNILTITQIQKHVKLNIPNMFKIAWSNTLKSHGLLDL
jgi:hypothetical protein